MSHLFKIFQKFSGAGAARRMIILKFSGAGAARRMVIVEFSGAGAARRARRSAPRRAAPRISNPDRN